MEKALHPFLHPSALLNVYQTQQSSAHSRHEYSLQLQKLCSEVTASEKPEASWGCVQGSQTQLVTQNRGENTV